MTRSLEWEGGLNVRDLGGLPTRDGRRTTWGAVVRAGSLDGLTARGWRELWEYGVRTVVDLRNDDERTRVGTARPHGLSTIHVPLDDADDEDLWREIRAGRLDGSPLYFPLFLARKPERCTAAVRAVAMAAPGGVVVHCGVGRDRTGLVVLLLLALVGVEPAAAAADYDESTASLAGWWADNGLPDQGAQVTAILRERGTTSAALVQDLVRAGDIERRLRAAGLTPGELAELRSRLVGD